MPHRRKARRLVPRLEAWYAAHARDLPWRRTHDPYAIWVSEIMLQQTQVATVIPYWKRWMAALPTVQKLASAKPERILKLWEGLGYYSRARNLQAAAQQIGDHHHGEFPQTPEALLALPGIGRYTAGAIASIAFGQAQPIVDGNITRVFTRLFGIREIPTERQTNRQLWSLAEIMVRAAADCSALNQSLMELGATVCTPRQPQCSVCPLARSCAARRNNAIDFIPAKPVQKNYFVKNIYVFIYADKPRFLIQQRPPDGVNAGFWEFPNSESNPAIIPPKNSLPIATARHAITNQRLTLQAYLMLARSPRGTWRSVEEIRALPFAAAHRKLLPALISAIQKAA